MPSLQDELKKVEQREADFYKNYPTLNRLDKAVDNSEDVVLFGGIVIIFLAAIIVRWVCYNFPTWHELLAIAAFSYIPGVIIISIFSAFFSRKHQQYLFKKYRIDRTAYEALIKQRTEFRTQKRDLESKLRKLREYNLKYNLNDFIDALKRSKYKYSDAKSYQQLLEEEYRAVPKSGFFYHTKRYYTNRLATIDGLLRNLFLKEDTTTPKLEDNNSTAVNSSTTFAPSPIEPKPYIPIEKQEESNRKADTTKSTEKKSSPVTENKPTPDIKIVSPANNAISKSNINKEKPVLKEEEKTVSELFGMPNTEVTKPEPFKTYQPKPPVKIDFPKLNEQRHNIGTLGELYAFEKEQNYLISKGKIKQSEEIIHISTTSDSEGYDIISFTDTGDRKYIEVKTTTGNQYEPFYLSNSEMEAMKRLNNYWIYRVYNFNVDLKKGDLYKIDCRKELETHYNIQPSSFRVSPKN